MLGKEGRIVHLFSIHHKGNDMKSRESAKTGSKGPWSESVFAHMLLEAASQLKTDKGSKPITSHPMFAQLNGTQFDGYKLMVKSLRFEPDGWESGDSLQL